MKTIYKIFLTIFTIFSIVSLIACGDSGSPVDNGTENDSSNSTNNSSSSENDSNSSLEGLLTLDDLPTTMNFGAAPLENNDELFVLAPSGFYSRYFLDDLNELTFHGVGTYTFEKDVATLTHGNASAAKELLDLYAMDDFTLSFKEEAGDLFGSKGDEYVKIEPKSLETYGNIKSANDIDGVYERVSGDTTETWTFFDDYEVAHELKYENVEISELGKYDTPYSLSGASLIYSIEKVMAPNNYLYANFGFRKISKTDSSLTITVSGVDLVFEKKSDSPALIDEADVVGEWAFNDGTNTWRLSLNQNNVIFKIIDGEGAKDYIGSGDSYKIYGNQIVIDLPNECSGNPTFVESWLGSNYCIPSIIGPITLENDELSITSSLLPTGAFTKITTE